MNSRRRIKPKPTNRFISSKHANEQRVLFQIFPETLWILIFTKLANSPATLFATLNASLVFRDIQHYYNLLCRYLFFVVWPKLFNHMIQKPDPGHKPSMGSTRGHNNVNRYVILRFRRVCKTWCDVMDNFFYNHPGHYPNADIYFQLYPDKAISRWPAISGALNLKTNFNLMLDWRATKFLPHYKDTHEQTSRSPFVSGAVELQLEYEEVDELQRKIVQSYGQHIFHCFLEFRRVQEGNYRKLHQILLRMPNLKSLKIGTLHSFGENVWQRVLPSLPYLRYLSIDSVSNDIVQLLLLTYGHVLTHLEFMGNYPYNRQIHPINCPKLKYFKASISDVASLCVLGLAKNVETVEVYFNGQIQWPLFYILQLLEQKLTEKCKTLVLGSMNCPMQQDCQYIRLGLKGVQRLKLVLGSYMPIDFILGLENTLEILHVTIQEIGAQGINCTPDNWKYLPWAASMMEREQIKFLSCLDQIHLSNIWSVFPKLKVLRLDLWFSERFEHWESVRGGLTKRVSWEENVGGPAYPPRRPGYGVF